MRKLVLCSLTAAAMAWGAPALAQGSGSTAVNPPAATGSPANTTAMAGDLKTGLSVKDSTGASVGTLTSLKTDASGKRWATIRIGADDVSVEADKLTAKDGAATVNMTQAQLKSMAKKPKS
jgi:hypothetical protein